MSESYHDFLKTKEIRYDSSGFEPKEDNQKLFQHSLKIVSLFQHSENHG